MPEATPVTIPELDTVAVEGLEETHGLVIAAVPLPVNVIVEPTQTELLPVIVGFELTVTDAVT